MNHAASKLTPLICSCLLLILFSNNLPASDPDSFFDIFDINEGDLQFLSKEPSPPPHHHSTHIVISESSLETGWVGNRQCHYNLDQVPAMQIVFREGNVRKLEITRAEQIGRTWIAKNTVQLINIGKDAIICITSETKSLKKNSLDNGYEWHGGPYMRRFLDGYFPMRITVAIDYPSDRLVLESIVPAELKLNAVLVPGHIRVRALFEGILSLTTLFRSQTQPK